MKKYTFSNGALLYGNALFLKMKKAFTCEKRRLDGLAAGATRYGRRPLPAWLILFAEDHLLPLLPGDEHLAGLGAFEGAHDPPFGHLVHQAGSPGIAQRLDLNVSYQQLLDKQEEVNLLKKNEEFDKFYQKFYESYNSENAAGELNRFLLDLISTTKGTEKEYFVQLLEKVQNQDFTPELYANTLATIFTRERPKIH